MDCLQFLEKLCVKETGIDSANTNNPHKRNNGTQRQNPSFTDNQKVKKEHVGKKSPTSQQVDHLQWDGQRSTLVNYIPKWHELLESSKSRRALKVLQQLVPPTYRKMVQNSSSLEESLMELATYCCPPEDMNDQAARNSTRKRKSSERNGSRNTQAESTPVKKKIKLPCCVCTGTNHSNLLGCPKIQKVPSRPVRQDLFTP